MPFYNYGARNGMASIVQGVRFLCRIYTKFNTPILLYIDGHPTLSTEQKTTIKAWLTAAAEVCYILETSVAYTYENETGT